MKVLITGSRNYPDHALVRNTLGWVNSWKATPYQLVHGGAQGTDRIAAEHARTLGWEVIPIRANWSQLGQAAGKRRNSEMVARGADLVLAFLAPCIKVGCPNRAMHYSHGTTDCLRKAEAAGLATLAFQQGLAPLTPRGQLTISKG